MEDNKNMLPLSEDEVTKAMELCVDDRSDCSECPYLGSEIKEGITCECKMINNALDVINRQKAEIERLQNEISKLKLKMSYMSKPNSIGDSHEMGSW